MRKIFLLLVTSSALYAEVIETFYQTGELKERYNLKDGVRDGIYTKWYLNGQIGRQANYKIGIMNGELKTWYPNGKVKEIQFTLITITTNLTINGYNLVKISGFLTSMIQ